MFQHVDIRHGHLFCGLGGGAKGFNKARPMVGNMLGKFRCIGGIDVDPAGIRDFERLTGVRGTVLDLADRSQYIAIHGREPGPDWREALPADVHRAFGYERPHIIFLSAPCKGFSGLLSEGKSLTDKYQAMNRLTERGVWLALEAFKDDPVELFVFENVPRIATRGRPLVDRIAALFRAYGYAVAETTHDCGEIGGLAQSRKRFLMVARHLEKVPPFLYEPDKKSLRAVGDVLGKMPLPGAECAGAECAGAMHRIPSLQWKTWVRLAFVEAGSDWRSLNKLAVDDGLLRDYLIVPERHAGGLGVNRWEEPSGTVTSRGLPNNGNFAVADPRQELYSAGYGVLPWDATAGAVSGESMPSNGRFAVADPRHAPGAEQFGQYGVHGWDDSMGAVIGVKSPGQGGFAVADPRHTGPAKHSNEFRIVHWDKAAQAVTSAHGSGQALADPRLNWNAGAHESKLHVTGWNAAHKAVTGARGPYSGAAAVADPRQEGLPFAKYAVTGFDEPAGVVIGGSTTGQGAFAVADPRPNMARAKGDHYLTGGHYGVVPYTAPSYAVSGSACHDNGWWSVADPRPMPAPADKLIARIRALDGTWHRPFTTLELAALQSLLDPEDSWMPWRLDGESDQAWRERIGNAVPSDAATGIAEVMGETLLLAWSGETFLLSARPVWVRPVAIALSISQPSGEPL
ncbi:MAG TPA: DNA cytosine methyltransferase [Ramlibacter sp.]|nr:DNA cytosine methyltransferase [Ramlibacter sp.]